MAHVIDWLVFCDCDFSVSALWCPLSVPTVLLGCSYLGHGQWKEIEENNRIGKTRVLFKKIRDTKGKSHAKTGSIKDINGMDLTKVEDIKNKWQEYTEELYQKKSSQSWCYDILECEVNWALGSITMNKSRGGDGIPIELFQILKHDAIKVLHSICQQI